MVTSIKGQELKLRERMRELQVTSPRVERERVCERDKEREGERERERESCRLP